MSAVPLEGFDPRFLPSCQKCGSSSINFQWGRHPFAWGKQELRSSCYTCGTVKYGEEQIRQAYEPSYKRWVFARDEETRLWREEQEARRAQEQEELRRQEEEARLLREAEEARLRREAEEEQERLNQLALQLAKEELARLQREEKKRLEKEERAARWAQIEESRKRDQERQLLLKRELKRERDARYRENKRLAAVKVPAQGEKCAWEPCANPSVENSKYCSRACSNKRARLNYRLKKAGG